VSWAAAGPEPWPLPHLLRGAQPWSRPAAHGRLSRFITLLDSWWLGCEGHRRWLHPRAESPWPLTSGPGPAPNHS